MCIIFIMMQLYYLILSYKMRMIQLLLVLHVVSRQLLPRVKLSKGIQSGNFGF